MGAAPFHIELARDPETGRSTLAFEGRTEINQITIKHGVLPDGGRATLLAIPNDMLEVRFDFDGLGLGDQDAFGEHPQQAPVSEPEPPAHAASRIIELEPGAVIEVEQEPPAKAPKIPKPRPRKKLPPKKTAPAAPKNPALRLPINRTSLGSRAVKRLRTQCGIYTVNQLVQHTKKELLAQPGVGEESIFKLRHWLAKHDLTLTGDVKPRDFDAVLREFEAAKTARAIIAAPVKNKPGPKPKKPLTPAEQAHRDECNERQRRRRERQMNPSSRPDIPDVVKSRTGLANLYALGLKPQHIDEFCAMTGQDLFDLGGFNASSIKDVKNRLAGYGMALGTPVPKETAQEGN